ncbi:hypothetical protein BC628DRAFT_1308624 [Trametes gibbosa]|nr:hypothetical protein BC628DRAFT_1308624 [Trametes gibbosa]
MSAPIALTLTLSPDNPSNTTILGPDRKVLYTVYTQHAKATVTHVQNPHGVVLASLQWRDVLPDRVTLAHNTPVSIRDWLHTSLVPFYLKDDVAFQDDSARKYKWRGNAPGRAFELYAEDDGYKEPIARFARSRPDRASTGGATTTTTTTMTPATLVLTARAAEVRDLVVLSFLFLEKTRRTNERAAQSRADVLCAPAFSALTGSDYNVRNGGV